MREFIYIDDLKLIANLSNKADVDNDLFKGGNPLPTHISELRILVDTVYATYKKEIKIVEI